MPDTPEPEAPQPAAEADPIVEPPAGLPYSIKVGPIDYSRATPELFAALIAAQASAETVAKDGRNNERNYNYATADGVIRMSRAVLAPNALGFFSTWERTPVFDHGGDIGNQFVCATVRMHWTLVHRTGAMLLGHCDMDAIGSRARPPDKAVAATLTFMRGFVLRDLLNLDRGEDDDSVDRRSDGDYQHTRQQQGQQRRDDRGQQQRPQQRRDDGPKSGERRVVKADKPEDAAKPEPETKSIKPAPGSPEADAHAAMVEAAKAYLAACKANDVKPQLYEVCGAAALGKGQRWNPRDTHTVEQYAAGTEGIRHATAAILGEADPNVCALCKGVDGQHVADCPDGPNPPEREPGADEGE